MMRLKEERREEREEVRKRMELIKLMDSKENDAVDSLKILLNQRFEKVRKVKEELFKEAEGIIKRNVVENDRKEM
jgi:hypothetical protein